MDGEGQKYTTKKQETIPFTTFVSKYGIKIVLAKSLKTKRTVKERHVSVGSMEAEIQAFALSFHLHSTFRFQIPTSLRRLITLTLPNLAPCHAG